jgi:prolyl-tRNA synthetase
VGKGDDVRQAAEALYAELGNAGFSVLYDDREATPGVKFKDADLIGIPWRVTIGGRALAQGGVEVKRRKQTEGIVLQMKDLQPHLRTHDE